MREAIKEGDVQKMVDEMDGDTYLPMEKYNQLEDEFKADKVVPGVDKMKYGFSKEVSGHDPTEKGWMYANVLDLTKKNGDAEALQYVRKEMLDHFTDVMGLEKGDLGIHGHSHDREHNVNFYFHGPLYQGGLTAGLHIHARLDQGFHPFENAHSVPLNAVIERLQNEPDKETPSNDELRKWFLEERGGLNVFGFEAEDVAEEKINAAWKAAYQVMQNVGLGQLSPEGYKDLADVAGVDYRTLGRERVLVS